MVWFTLSISNLRVRGFNLEGVIGEVTLALICGMYALLSICMLKPLGLQRGGYQHWRAEQSCNLLLRYNLGGLWGSDREWGRWHDFDLWCGLPNQWPLCWRVELAFFPMRGLSTLDYQHLKVAASCNWCRHVGRGTRWCSSDLMCVYALPVT